MKKSLLVASSMVALAAGLAGQQAPVPSAAPTVQAGDTRPIHVYIRSGLKKIEGMILRGIAWAAHYPVDTLVNGAAPARQGGRGRRGGGGDAPTAPGGRRGGQ